METLISSSMAPTAAQSLALWPVPGPSLSQYTHARWHGASPETTEALGRYLQRDYGFFNYTPWALGGTLKHLDAIWDEHDDVERYAFQSPAPITKDTAFDHLKDRDYYQAYLHFFSDILLKTPLNDVLEEWIFSPTSNFGGKLPQMPNRLLDGILHPMLYLGYGIEFSMPGLIAEGKHLSLFAHHFEANVPTGLAQVATHRALSSTLLSRSMFEGTTKSGSGMHAFTILSRIMSDKAFEKYVGSFDNPQTKLGQKIQAYAAEWLVDGANPQEVAKKMQE